MAGVEGFEPPALGFGERGSISSDNFRRPKLPSLSTLVPFLYRFSLSHVFTCCPYRDSPVLIGG